MGYFAERTNWDLRSNELTEILNGLKTSGQTIYDLTVSNPTRCGIPFSQKKFLDVLSDRRSLDYDPNPNGMLCARRAIAAYYADQGVDLRPEQVFLTASTSEAYGFLFRLLVNPQQNVMFPKPSYPLFEFLSGIHDVQWRTYDLVYAQRWQMDQAGFQGVIDGQTRAAILVNPNNPTGSSLSQGEIDAIYQQCIASDIPIICDEVFADYHYSDEARVQTLAGRKDHLTFVLNGLSKLLAFPQMKCSWIVINGSDDAVKQAGKRLEIIADTYLSVNTPVQQALPEWMSCRVEIQRVILDRICSNRRFLQEQVTQGSKAQVLEADGGWSAVVRCPGIDEEKFILELLNEQQVFVHPGYFFDFQDSGHIVISLLPEADIFQEGVRRFLKGMNV